MKQISKKQVRNIVLIALLAYLGNAAGNLIVRFPEASIHDEFSNLLAAETFLSGRLAIPSHPHWEHFQTFHILQKPTYASKYLPGTSLLLAFGQKLSGNPSVGLWIGSALLSISIYWMLTGIVSRCWGFLGGLFTALNFCVLGYWAQTYYGGHISAIGCSLVYGSLFRLSKKITIFASLICGVGLVLLLLSRPFEALFAITPGLIYFVYLYLGQINGNLRSSLVRLCLPAGCTVLIGFLWLGYYNYRVTGNALQLPYMIYRNQYLGTPLFLWDEPESVNEGELQEFKINYQFHLERFKHQQSLAGFLAEKGKATITNILFYFRFIFLLPVCMLPFLWKESWIPVAVIAIILVWSIALCEYQSLPRKIAPATGLIILILIEGLRVLRSRMVFYNKIGNRIAIAIIVVFLISVPTSFHPIFHSRQWQAPFFRKKIESRLIADGGKHIVFVSYDKQYVPHFDYVQNHAIIDSYPVVWARNLSTSKNKRLIDYYRNRKPWILSVNKMNSELKPYRF